MGRFHMFLVVIFFFSFFGKERTTIHRRFWRGVSKSHTFPLTKRYVGKAFPMYFQYISHACWPRILPVYFHVFVFCWLVGPKFWGRSPFFCSRQTFYGFQVQVKNAASYLRTQLNAWCGSQASQEGELVVPGLVGLPVGKFLESSPPPPKSTLCFYGLGFLETRRDSITPVWSWTVLIFVLPKTTVSGVNSLQFVFF